MTAYNTLQHNISNIYNILTSNDELNEIKHFFMNSQLYYNENFSVRVSQLDKLLNSSRKILNQLTESTSEIEVLVKQCKNLLMIEQKKDSKLQKLQNQYTKISA